MERWRYGEMERDVGMKRWRDRERWGEMESDGER